MNRDTYRIEQRNKAICEMYYGLIRTGMPFMQAYAETGERFWLSESHIRRVIAHYAQHSRRK